MAQGIGHAANSPFAKVNQAWRRIALAVLGSAAIYKVWRNYTRLDSEIPQTYPGAYTGSTGIAPAERKSPYEGAGNSALGRRRGINHEDLSRSISRSKVDQWWGGKGDTGPEKFMRLDPVPGDYRPPGLVKEAIYSTKVPKKLVSKVIDAVKLAVPNGADNLQHIKRVQPCTDCPDLLNVLLCTQSKISADDLQSVLSPVLGPEICLCTGFQSKYPARTKAEASEWSEVVWPLMWRGNTLAQPPKINSEDAGIALGIIESLIANTSSQVDVQCTAQCWIRDPQLSEPAIVGKGSENLQNIFSKRHAVMNAVNAVADYHRSVGDAGYLCVDMDVYCDTEPCVMCCMALVHSRIKRLFYKHSSPSTKGGIEVYCLHGRSQLNHTFEAWRVVE